MYTITLEVNQVCNLKCNYCYLGQKNGTVMEYETAIEAIDIAFINVKKHQDAKIWVDFVGGEALLNLELVKRIQEWTHKKALENKIIVIYSQPHLYYMYSFIKIYTIGATNIKLSNLSSIPPCPGIIFPKSFILQYLLIADAVRSPNCPATDAAIPTIIQ